MNGCAEIMFEAPFIINPVRNYTLSLILVENELANPSRNQGEHEEDEVEGGVHCLGAYIPSNQSCSTDIRFCKKYVNGCVIYLCV